MKAELFDVDRRMDGQPSRTEYWLFGNVRSVRYSSLCYLYKTFTRHGLTLCGFGVADGGNVVTVVVNCCEGDSTIP